jgi:hypothetical protein
MIFIDGEEFMVESVECPECHGSGDGERLDVDRYATCFFCKGRCEIEILIPFDDPPEPQPLWAPDELPRKPAAREIPDEEKAA